MYRQEGGVRLSVVNEVGREAVVAILGPGDFFGEARLAGQSTRMTTATAIGITAVLIIDKHEMIRALHEEHEFSDRFMAYMLTRNIRVEEDLIDQLFKSNEKRLARTLMLLARYGSVMVGTTRSRVNVLMNKFRKLGFIEYNGKIKVNTSRVSVVLHD
jgi:CRP/FNR family transcriptional regulator, cyclic AMP receptor protein